MRVLALSKSPEGCCPREMTSPIWVITSLGTACVCGVCVCGVCGGGGGMDSDMFMLS